MYDSTQLTNNLVLMITKLLPNIRPPPLRDKPFYPTGDPQVCLKAKKAPLSSSFNSSGSGIFECVVSTGVNTFGSTLSKAASPQILVGLNCFQAWIPSTDPQEDPQALGSVIQAPTGLKFPLPSPFNYLNFSLLVGSGSSTGARCAL